MDLNYLFCVASFLFSQIQVLSLIWNQAVSLHNIPVLHHWFKHQLIAESIYKPYIIKSYGKLANWDVPEREREREEYDALNLSPSSRENSFMSKFMTKSGFDEQQ